MFHFCWWHIAPLSMKPLVVLRLKWCLTPIRVGGPWSEEKWSGCITHSGRKGCLPSWGRSWEGPYIVVKKINNLVYRIQLGPRSKPKVVHHNRLWVYSGNSKPTWFHSQLPESTDATSGDSRVSVSEDNTSMEGDDDVEGCGVQDNTTSQGNRRYPLQTRHPIHPYGSWRSWDGHLLVGDSVELVTFCGVTHPLISQWPVCAEHMMEHCYWFCHLYCYVYWLITPFLTVSL